jgi:hypothetical protein
MAGSETSNGAASSVTEESPNESRSNMARRVGSAKAAKVKSRVSVKYLTMWLIITEEESWSTWRRKSPSVPLYERGKTYRPFGKGGLGDFGSYSENRNN